MRRAVRLHFRTLLARDKETRDVQRETGVRVCVEGGFFMWGTTRSKRLEIIFYSGYERLLQKKGFLNGVFSIFVNDN